MAKIIGIIAIKGGVGKTSCTANIGAVLADNFNKKVLLVDANFSAPNLGFHFGLIKPKATLQETIHGKIPIEDAIHEYKKNLHIIPAALEGKTIKNPFMLKKKLNTLRKYYDIILIDASPSLNNEILSTMLASDELYVVASPDYPTLSTTMSAIKIAKKRKTPIKGLILNRVRNKKFELTIEEIEDAAEVPVLGLLPDNIKMLEAVANTIPMSEHSPNADPTIEFNKIAAYMIGEEYADNRIIAKIRKLFNKNASQVEINREIKKE
jgi:septum site-determining protein MinD